MIRAHAATLAASGPTESSDAASGIDPSMGTRRAVGLKATSPQTAAGIRTEPAVSEPIAATAMPSVTEMAAPDEEPPGIRPVLCDRTDFAAFRSAG